MPFTVDRNQEILQLTLDTPGAQANIFNRATGRQTLELLAGVTPANTRAVVFRTAKPQSFMNGVGLMLANAANSYDDVVRASDELRAAFDAVRNLAVPTVAAIQGTCWGCGVEFVLNTRYRIAADTYDTHFYMTELPEYLFIPLFRSTKNLPETVGLDDAIRMLLWGERWDVRRAAGRGLINEYAPVDGFDAAVDAFVERVLRQEVASCIPSRDELWYSDHAAANAQAEARARARIAELAPVYQGVYTDALELLLEAAQRPAGEEQRLHELQKCSDSTISALGKSAYAFFYIRQIAAALAQGRVEGRPAHDVSRRIVVAGVADVAAVAGVPVDGRPRPHGESTSARDAAYRAFTRELSARRLPGVTFTSALETGVRGDSAVSDAHLVVVEPAALPTTWLVPPHYRGHLPQGIDAVAVQAEFSSHVDSKHPFVLYRAIDLPGSRFFELVERTPSSSASFARYLARAGYQTAVSSARTEFGTNRLLRGYFTPLVRFVVGGGAPESVEATLRALGFSRRARELLAGVPRRALAACLQPATGATEDEVSLALALLATSPGFAGGRVEDELVDALTVSLVAAVGENLHAAVSEGGYAHPSLIDLAAREVLDFPLALRSLCRYLSRERVQAALPRSRRLVDGQWRDRAERFAGGKAEFYR